MFQGCYTSEAIAGMIKKPEDRSAAVRSLVESVGGKLEGFWLTFGESDFVLIMQLPDSQAAAALALAVAASGSLHDCKTTELLSWADGVSALKKAAAAKYQPPAKAAK
jgi:uncharacterized protein with GYD domain